MPSDAMRRVPRAAAFGAACSAVAAALLLEPAATLVLSAHMTQHLLLAVVGPALLVWSRPALALRRALPLRWRLATKRSAAVRVLGAVADAAQAPGAAWLMICGPFLFWHLPGPYRWLLDDAGLRGLALASFFLGALAFWSSVLSNARRRRHGAALGLIAAAAATTSLPGALLSFAPRTLYHGLPDPLPICGLSALEDQQLAGLIMWLPMDAILLGAACFLFLRWMRERPSALGSPRRVCNATATVPVLLLALMLAACDEAPPTGAVGIGGDPKHGAALIGHYGCGGCHIIPGIAGAQGLVGPPLIKMGRRIYIAGLLRNTPENLMAWLQDPQRFVPGNAMPNMGISAADSRDLAAFLATLK